MCVCVQSKLSATAGGAAAAAAATAAPRSPSPTQGGLSPPLTSQTKPVVQLMCMFPSTRGSPPAIVVTLNSPRVMLQLRYIMVRPGTHTHTHTHTHTGTQKDTGTYTDLCKELRAPTDTRICICANSRTLAPLDRGSRYIMVRPGTCM